MEAQSVRRTLSWAFSGATLLFLILGCYLFLVGSTGSGGEVTEPYENYLLYAQHYDWVVAPFLQAFRAASISAICAAIAQLIPRGARRPRVWIPGAVVFLAVPITVFNIVVDYMTSTNWLFNVYLAMSWFEPWLMLTLGTVSQGFLSTGGIAFVALLISAAAFFEMRLEQGAITAATETLLFLSTALLLFELGIAEYRSFWWDRQVTGFQYTIGLSWLTNQLLFSASAVSTSVLACLRIASWRLHGRNLRGTRATATL